MAPDEQAALLRANLPAVAEALDAGSSRLCAGMLRMLADASLAS
jgi:hypothetical protein